MERSTLTAKEVGDILGCATSTVHQQAKEGNLPSIKLGDRTLFPARAIRHLAETGTLPPAVTADSAATIRTVLELERRTAEARIAIIDGMLGEIEPKPELPPKKVSKRVARVQVRELP